MNQTANKTSLICSTFDQICMKAGVYYGVINKVFVTKVKDKGEQSC